MPKSGLGYSLDRSFVAVSIKSKVVRQVKESVDRVSNQRANTRTSDFGANDFTGHISGQARARALHSN